MDTIQILLRQLASLPLLTLRAEPPELLRTVERFLWDLAAHDDSSVTSLAIDGLAALATQRGSVIAHLQLCSAGLSSPRHLCEHLHSRCCGGECTKSNGLLVRPGLHFQALHQGFRWRVALIGRGCWRRQFRSG